MKWALLAATHCLALLAGGAAGALYFVNDTASQSLIASVTRQPINVASELSFRFGPPAHARAVLETLHDVQITKSLDERDSLVIEARLTLLDLEEGNEASYKRHLNSALTTCRRIFKDGCNEQNLSRFANVFGHSRHE